LDGERRPLSAPDTARMRGWAWSPIEHGFAEQQTWKLIANRPSTFKEDWELKKIQRRFYGN
jgi:hypothetical protein